MRKTLLIVFFLLFFVSFTYAQLQFWGSTSSGGENGNGFIFRTDSIGDNLEIIHHFKSSLDGENISALLLASNNKLYGLAGSGGLNATGVFNGGTFFEYDLYTDQFRVIQHFGPSNTALPNVYLPRAEGQPVLTEVSPGLIYGLMRQGEYVFSYNVATGAMGQPFALPLYQGGAANGTLRNKLYSTFLKAADGFLYASASTNSSCPIPNPYGGSIVKVNPNNNAITIPHKSSCQIEFGYSYNGNLTEVNGKLYGTTLYGGLYNKGVIYEYVPATNTYSKVHDFNGGVYNYQPTSLVRAKNGKLYGTAHGGGIPETNLPSGGGVLYEFDITTNTFAKKYDFLLGVSWLGDVGVFPGGLVSSSNGKVYGVTQFGVFEYNTMTNDLRMAGRFWNLGYAPSLVQVCRKPVYQYQSMATYEICKDASFTLDMVSANAISATWKHNNIVDPLKTTTALSFTAFTAADAGTWVCTLTNECGTTTAQTFTLILSEPDQPAIATGGPIIFCSGETVTLSAPQGFAGYAWSNGATSREIVVSESGDYRVSVNNGCESPLSEAITITVHELPATPTGIEAPTLHTLKALGDVDQYEWILNDIVLDIQTSVIPVTESGMYKVRSISSEGCRSAGYVSLQFQLCSNPGYQAPAANTYAICKDASFQLNLGGTNATSITWRHNNSIDPSRTNSVLSFASFTFEDAGEWVCTLVNECGTTVTPAINLVFKSIDRPVITAKGAIAFCEGDNVTLSAPEGFDSYEWSTGATSREIVVKEKGEYTLVVAMICKSPLSEAMTITTHMLPAAPERIEVVSSDVLRAIGNSETYEWTLNSTLLEAKTPELHAEESGIYTVRSVSDKGCRSAEHASLSFALTGLEDSRGDNVIIYPNPAKGILNVQFSNSVSGKIELLVLNGIGNVVYVQSISATNEAYTIHLENQPVGLYQMVIRNEEKTIVRKIVLR